MFTGLIEAVGSVTSVRPAGGGRRLVIAVEWPDGLAPAAGDSVAVDGVCLTAVDPADRELSAELSPETVRRTTLGDRGVGHRVNVERALRAGDRLGGHLVQGHVDGTGSVVGVRRQGAFATIRVAFPATLGPEIAEKGSVAVDGISLTVAGLGEGWFEVALIPTTLAGTNLGDRRSGERVNLETDVLAKYVRRQLAASGVGAIEREFGAG